MKEDYLGQAEKHGYLVVPGLDRSHQRPDSLFVHGPEISVERQYRDLCIDQTFLQGGHFRVGSFSRHSGNGKILRLDLDEAFVEKQVRELYRDRANLGTYVEGLMDRRQAILSGKSSYDQAFELSAVDKYHIRASSGQHFATPEFLAELRELASK